MKKYLIGFVGGVALTFLSFDVVRGITDTHMSKYYDPCVLRTKEKSWSQTCYSEYKKQFPTMKAIDNLLTFPTIGLFDPLTGRCVPTGTDLGGGREAKGRDYFNCNDFQNFISDIIYGNGNKK